jgi:hypothetical protein
MVDSEKGEENEIGRIIQSYFMVGLRKEKITKYHDEENEIDFLQQIDMMITDVKIKIPIYKPNAREKWQALNKTTWLRCEYNNIYSKPITCLKIIDCQIHENYLVIN